MLEWRLNRRGGTQLEYVRKLIEGWTEGCGESTTKYVIVVADRRYGRPDFMKSVRGLEFRTIYIREDNLLSANTFVGKS